MSELQCLWATIVIAARQLRATVRDQRGITTETAIITALLSVAAVGAATYIGSRITDWLSRIQ